MFASLAGSIFRHALTALGGALVTHGWMAAAMVEPTIGAVLTLGGVALSVWNKYRNRDQA